MDSSIPYRLFGLCCGVRRFGRGEQDYDAARAVHNALIDRRPALIAKCAGAADVIACVRFARESGLPMSVRGGGHSIAGKAVCDDGIVIDLSAMKGIRVDPAKKTVRAEAGLTIGEFDRETQAFGLATTMGVISTTGISGLTLGGGMGWLIGKNGLACDNVLSVDIVTADGALLHASRTENEDLFWGVRGGGGNFGIVTSFDTSCTKWALSLVAVSGIRSKRQRRFFAFTANSRRAVLTS